MLGSQWYERLRDGPHLFDHIAHHLRLAERSDTLFSDDAVARIHKVSRGLPGR